MTKIMTVLVVCLALAPTMVSYGSIVPVSFVTPLTECPGEEIGMAVNLVEGDTAASLAGWPVAESPDMYASSIAAKIAASAGNDETANAEEEGEAAEKKDDKEDQGGPDRLWDAGKLG